MQQQRRLVPALMHTIFKSLWLPLLALPGLLFTNSIFANNDLLNLTTGQSAQQIFKLAHQRNLYQQANRAYKNRRFSQFVKHSSQLKDYPLYPYLQYQSLMRRPSILSDSQIHAFLQINDDTVIGNRFRSKLIKHSAKTRNWKRLIDIYRPNYGLTAQCHYLNALLKTGQQSLAYPKIENLWLSPRSLPKSCDPAFKQWQAAGHKTPTIIWQRFKLSMSVNNRSLASYLVKSMPAKDARIAKLWLNVHKRPQRVTTDRILNINHPDQGEIVLHGLKRLSYKDITLAMEAYHQLNAFPFSEAQRSELIRHFALRLARTHMPDAGIWLARIADDHADKQVKEWRIRTAIRQGDWHQVLVGINDLTLNKRADYRWQYWWAYANEQLGNTDDALGIYQYLAHKRSYYGFLAADHLNLPYSFEDKVLSPSTQAMSAVFQQPEAIRAREFYFMGEILPARREWNKLISHIDNDQRLAASKIAQAWSWHDRAIVTMGKTRYRDDITLRFPMHLDNNVYAWSSRHNIDPAWTYAIIRRESAFMSDAKSSVGAMGLMQLMPNTARQVARQLKIRYRGRNSLLASSTNIRLGTGYLERMLDKLNKQQVLATAAYNAGPHRVKKWLPELHNMDAIRWIETIPYTETREYVSNVLAYMAIYEHRMEKPVTRLSLRMPPVQAKNPLTLPPPVISQANPSPVTGADKPKAQSQPENGPT